MPQLRVKNGPAEGKTYELNKEVVQLGREAEIQVLDTAASRHHAEVFAIGDMFFLRDLDSRNGTYLNEERITSDDQALLRVGDLIRIGSTQVVFEEAAPAREEPVPDFTSGEEDYGATMELALDAEGLAGTAATDEEASLHFAVLYDVAKAASEAFDVTGLLQKVCDIALGATRADGVYAFTRQESKLVPVAHARRPGGRKEPKISSTIVKRSLQHRRAVLVSDASRDTRFSASSSVVMKGIRSAICAPLTAQDRISGVIYLHSSSVEDAFTDDHLRLVTAMALEAAVAMEAMRAEEKNRRQLMSVFRTLIHAYETGSPEATEGHSEQVHRCARAICQALELPPAEARHIELGALLHEIGKVGAPEGAFQRAENRFAYATLGAEMLRKIEGMETAAGAVAAHLERLDGSGGPEGLVGHQIGRSARIVGLADEFTRRLHESSAAGRSAAIKQALIGLNQEVPDRYDAEAFNGLVVALRTGAFQPVSS
ncbi:MAG: HD domain-containing phosphohydrolase [bacterium]